MATSYNACSPMTSFSAPKESFSTVGYPQNAHSPSSPVPTFQSHTGQFNFVPGNSHTPFQNAQCQPYSSAYTHLNNYGHYEASTIDHTALMRTYFSSTPVSSSSSFSSSLTSAYSAPSPQPSLYQVPPQFRRSISPINGYSGKMAKYGLPFSNEFSPVSPNTPPSVTLPSTSFSFSPRNIRPATYTSSTTTADTRERMSFSTSRKSSQLSHYASARSSKADILLDRKAFISLEKSINWQAALPCSTSAPLTPSAQHSSPFQCSPDSANSLQGQSYHLNSPRLTQVTSAMQAVNDYSKEGGSFSPSEGQWNAGNADRDFTLPGMKDVPAWLKLLRLHKYAPFFARMSYEEMLELTEDVLEHRNITKGARQKLILSIQKLKARSAVLLASEHELLDVKGKKYRSKTSYSSLSQVLFQIRAFLSTPIRPLICNRISSSSSSFTPLFPSPCATCRPGHAPPTFSGGQSFLSSTQVDFNNNNNNGSSNSSYSGSCQSNGREGAVSPDHKEILLCWSLLNNEDLPDIMTRLIGHVHYILVKKCKKRLKTLNLWKEHFKDIHDKLSCANLPEKDTFEQFSGCVDNRNEQAALSLDSDREENEEDEDSGLLNFISSMTLGAEGRNTTTSTHFGSLSSTPNGTEDKDSGVDEAAGDSDTGSLESDILTTEEEEELYMVLRSVLDKCISHEAFWPHQTLFRYWRQQLQCMISALRYLVTDCPTASTNAASVTSASSSASPFTLKKLQFSDNYASSYSSSRYLNTAAHCKSPVPPAQHLQQCHSPNGLGSKSAHKSAGTFPSYKKPLTNLNINSSNSHSTIIYSKANSSPALSVGRRLLHNRLRSSIGGTVQQQQHSLSASSCMSSSSSLHHCSTAPATSIAGQLLMSSAEESTTTNAGHVHSNEQRTASGKLGSTGKLVDSSAVTFQGTSPTLNPYSNLSVIPQLSSALFSCAPITALNLNPNVAGNSPEANLRNLLLQLTSQQQQQLPAVHRPNSPAAASPNSSITNNSSSTSVLNESFNSESTNWHSSSLLNSLLDDDSSRTCSNTTHKDNDEDCSSCCQADKHKQPHDFDNVNDNNLYSLWSLNGQVLENDDNGQEAKKAADWKAATGLLSNLDLCSSDGHHHDLEDMLLTIESWGSSAKCAPSETVTTFNDIEQLCIRMAEHALDINDDSVFS